MHKFKSGQLENVNLIQNRSMEIHSSRGALRAQNSNTSFLSPLPRLSTRLDSVNLLEQKITKSAIEYEKILKQKSESGKDTTEATKLLSALKQQAIGLKLHSQKSLISNIQLIFNFYSRVKGVAGVSPSFGEIEKHSNHLSNGKYLIFCRDFSLSDTHSKKDRKVITRKQILAIYNKNSYLQKSMTIEQFRKSLDDVALMYYDDEFDLIYGSRYKELTLDAKRTMLYEFIGIHDVTKLKAKFRGLSSAADNVDYRFPSDDLAKRYQYKPRRFLRRDVTPQPMLMNDDSQDSLEYNFAKRLKRQTKTPQPQMRTAAADAIIQKNDENSQQISSMRFEDFDEEDALQSLIVEDDEYDKLLGIEYPDQPRVPSRPPAPPSGSKLRRRPQPTEKYGKAVQRAIERSIS